MNEYHILSLSERIPAKPKLHWKIDIIDHWMLEKIEHFIRIHPYGNCTEGVEDFGNFDFPAAQHMHGSFNLLCGYCFTKTVILSETLAFGSFQPDESLPVMSGNGIPQYRYICLPGLWIIERVIQMPPRNIP